ncbi:glycosyl hydrolase family 28-related protein [Pseudarthrobacter sp. L19]|uniref:glycosyl hydrolase family 28-related protein n=1 Tax=Pseudarthrobacter sp. L19 TaxID=3423951 RepID=UPI003D7B8315
MGRKFLRAGIFVLAIAMTALVLGLGQLTTASRNSTCQVSGSKASRSVEVSPSADEAGDDSTQIQKAINAAAQEGGAIVKLPRGTLHIDRPLVLRSNVELRGEGNETVLKASHSFLDSKGPYGGHP